MMPSRGGPELHDARKSGRAYSVVGMHVIDLAVVVCGVHPFS